MKKVLINSYTCCPNMGSEPGMGWNWIVNLARHCEVYVISEGEYRATVEDWVASEKLKVKSEKLAFDDPRNFAERMHFYWNPVSPEVRKMCWNQGDWRFYKYYKEWQKKTADIAREICGKEKIDVLHQLNMIGFREPGYLWKVSQETGIPFVWGPVDAKESFPMAYASDAPFMTKMKMHLKNVVTWCQLKYGKRVHAAAKQGVVISASSNSQRSFKKFMGIESPLINETGCSLAALESTSNQAKRLTSNLSTFSILWVGKIDFRKQLGLALQSVATMNRGNVMLHVVGGGDSATYREQAERLEISDKVKWHGAVTHAEVQELMRTSDVMLFTSVAEGTPHVVLEAIANGLPVICHDTCGHGDCVDDSVGVKIPLSNPSQSVHDFTDKLRYFYDNREELQKRVDNCLNRAVELSWDNKVKKVLAIYEGLAK